MNTETVRINIGSFTSKTSVSSESCLSLQEVCAFEHNPTMKISDDYELIIEPSFACDLCGNHCFVPSHNPQGLDESDVLQLIADWSDIVVSERGEMGGTLHLRGGEPLMLPYINDILDLLRYKKTLGFIITTNGINTNRGTIKRLRKLHRALKGNARVNISLDGSNDQINSQFHASGSFARTVRFIRLLRRAGIEVHLNNTVHLENSGDLEAFVKLALCMGVARVNFIPYEAGSYLEKMRYARPNPIELYNRIEAMCDKGGSKVASLLKGSLKNMLSREANDLTIFPSQDYRGLIRIEPDGTAYSCPDPDHFGIKAGNVKKESIADIHNLLKYKLYVGCNIDSRFELPD